MERLEKGDRVRIVHTEFIDAELQGRTGTVVGLEGEVSAWVDMDADLPPGVRLFQREDLRANHIILWPDECELLILNGPSYAQGADQRRLFA